MVVRIGDVTVNVKPAFPMFQGAIEASFVIPVTESDSAIFNYRFRIHGNIAPVIFEHALSQILNAQSTISGQLMHAREQDYLRITYFFAFPRLLLDPRASDLGLA